MERENIILSNVDLNLMKFLKEEHIIQDIVTIFNFGFSKKNLHIKRLKKLNCIDIKKFGNFRKVELNKRGYEILNFFKCIK